MAWFSGPSATGPWTDLEVTNESYTPKAADSGNYLRVVFTYNDKFGDGKTAEAVSDMPVEDKTLSNARPEFEGEDAVPDATETGFQVSLTTKEGAAKGTSIGDPVSATDEDNDVLRYMIVAEKNDETPPVDTTDYAKFAIDPKSGQLKVDTVLNFEPAGSINDGQAYMVTVRVVDPSGATADADVTITLENVNEPPIFNEDSDGRTTVYIAENTEDSTAVFNEMASVDASSPVDGDGGTDVTYVATDDDGTDTDSAVAYSLEGADRLLFAISPTDGGLTKVGTTEVDFETKSSYSIVVLAATTRGTAPDTVSMYDRVSVTVEVVNNDDDGEVSLTQREPQVGSSVAASVSDVDGGVSYVAWQWYRLTANDATTAAEAISAGNAVTVPQDNCVEEEVGTASCILDGATSASYTVTEYDLDRHLMAQATYNDKFNMGADDGKTMADGVSDAAVQDEDPANTAPEFGDQDRNTPGDQDEMVTRSVAENTDAGKNVGDSFTADDSIDGDLLMYTLGGPDADSFGLSKPTGIGNSVNLQTKADLDFETKNEYTVTITASDPSGASDMITVTVNVTDEDDGATISLTNNAPAFDDATADEFMVDENMPMARTSAWSWRPTRTATR